MKCKNLEGPHLLGWTCFKRKLAFFFQSEVDAYCHADCPAYEEA